MNLLAVFLGAAFSCAPADDSRPASSKAPERAWTFLIYGACDNNAETDGNFFAFLDGVRASMADDAGVDVVLFLDRAEGYSTNARTLGEDFTDARLYHVRASGCTRLAGGEQFPEITLTSTFEPDSSEAENVRKFIAFGKAKFPAKRTALMLYGHANGMAMCPDEKTRRMMGFSELTQVATAKEAVDLMALELCTMGGIEIAYQWRPGNGGFSTDTLVAIPNAGPPLDWSRVFKRLRAPLTANLTGPEFGTMIVEEGGAGRREAGETHESVGCYDLTKAAAVKKAVDALAVELAKTDTKKIVAELRGPGPDGFALNYSNDRLERGPWVDLADLCKRIAACERLDATARAAAKAVLSPVDDLIVASYGGSDLPRFEAGKNGVFITIPDERTWRHCTFYTPLPVKEYYGRLSWCADGAKPGNGQVENWFELLDRWYDDVKSGTEGSNGYAP